MVQALRLICTRPEWQGPVSSPVEQKPLGPLAGPPSLRSLLPSLRSLLPGHAQEVVKVNRDRSDAV